MQTRCQLKGSLNLSSGICRNRAVSFLFCTTWQHSLGDFLLLGNFLFHHEIEHALCTCLVVTATKNVSLTVSCLKLTTDSQKIGYLSHIFVCPVAVKLMVRLTFGHEFCQYCSEFVKRQYIREFVHGWEGLSNSRQTYYSLYLQLFSRFLSVAILTH